jgi:hypothetical protein
MNVHEVRQSQTQVTILKKSQQRSAEMSFDQQLQKTVAAETKSGKAEPMMRGAERPAALTNSEKEYFEHLFPKNADEVRSYNPYQRDGGAAVVKLGTLVDKRG